MKKSFTYFTNKDNESIKAIFDIKPTVDSSNMFHSSIFNLKGNKKDLRKLRTAKKDIKSDIEHLTDNKISEPNISIEEINSLVGAIVKIIGPDRYSAYSINEDFEFLGFSNISRLEDIRKRRKRLEKKEILSCNDRNELLLLRKKENEILHNLLYRFEIVVRYLEDKFKNLIGKVQLNRKFLFRKIIQFRFKNLDDVPLYS